MFAPYSDNKQAFSAPLQPNSKTSLFFKKASKF